LPFELAAAWGDRCIEEFTNQVKMEENLGLPVSMFMKGLDSIQQKGRMQADFARFVLRPLWAEMARLLPDALPPDVLPRLEAARELYEGWAALPVENEEGVTLDSDGQSTS